MNFLLEIRVPQSVNNGKEAREGGGKTAEYTPETGTLSEYLRNAIALKMDRFRAWVEENEGKITIQRVKLQLEIPDLVHYNPESEQVEFFFPSAR